MTQPSNSITLKTAWTHILSGGYKNPLNPQILFEVRGEPLHKVSITAWRGNFAAEAEGDSSSAESPCGMVFFLTKNVSGERTNLKPPSCICAESQYIKTHTLQETFNLEPGKYNIVFCLQKKGLLAPLEVKIETSKGELQAHVLPDQTSLQIEGQWFEGQCGGYMRIDNPQIPFKVTEDGNFTITLEKLEPQEKLGIIFFILPWDKTKKRRKTYTETDIVAQSIYIASLRVFAEVQLNAGSYIIIPCAKNTLHGRFRITVEGLIHKMDNLQPQIAVNSAQSSSQQKELDCMEILSQLEVEDKVFFSEDPAPKLIAYLKEKEAVFRDSVFPPTDDSIYDKTGTRTNRLRHDVVAEWKRTSDIFDAPNLYVDGIAVEDIVQSKSLGNCWLCQGIATSATSPDRIQELFSPSEYNPYGVYSVRLFHEGNFHYVLVDDYIPCTQSGEPAFAHSKDYQEIWTMILEKAFAKVFESYEGLVSNDPGKALLYITGGKVDQLKVSDDPSDTLWQKMLHYCRQKWIMAVTTSQLPDEDKQTMNDLGIVSNHAYSVIQTYDLPQFDLRLVRIRNTWGHSEWKGAWSDKSSLWTEEVKQLVTYEDKEDGIFFMTFEDMCSQFNYITFCQITRDDYPHAYRTRGEFDPGQGAYGAVNNPKFALTVREKTKFIIRFILNEDDNPRNRPMRLFVCQGRFKARTLTKEDIICQSRYLTTQKLILECTLEPSPQQYIIYVSLGQEIKPNQPPVPFKLSVATDKEIDFNLPYLDPYPHTVELNNIVWKPCGGYMCTQNPRFRIVLGDASAVRDDQSATNHPLQQESEESELIFDVRRTDGHPAKGMRLALLRYSQEIPLYLRDENCLKLSKYKLTKFISMDVSLPAGEYLLIACLQEKNMEEVIFDLGVRSERIVTVERVL